MIIAPLQMAVCRRFGALHQHIGMAFANESAASPLVVAAESRVRRNVEIQHVEYTEQFRRGHGQADGSLPAWAGVLIRRL